MGNYGNSKVNIGQLFIQFKLPKPKLLQYVRIPYEIETKNNTIYAPS